MNTEIHKELILECLNGSRKAQFQLYQLYSKAMYNVCFRLIQNETDAEDILQQTFVDVFTKLQTFGFQSTIGAWIKRVTINNCINYLKKRKFEWQELDNKWHNVADVDESPMNGLSIEKVKRAIHALPEGYRVVFSLYALEGYDHEEIAEVLGISESTSKSQYSRAKQKVRELILKEGIHHYQ